MNHSNIDAIRIEASEGFRMLMMMMQDIRVFNIVVNEYDSQISLSLSEYRRFVKSNALNFSYDSSFAEKSNKIANDHDRFVHLVH